LRTLACESRSLTCRAHVDSESPPHPCATLRDGSALHMYGLPTNRQSDWRTLARLPGLIVVCFGRFWVFGLPFPNARHLGHPFQWKTTLPWHLGPAAKVRSLRFKDLSPFRHYRGLQNHV